MVLDCDGTVIKESICGVITRAGLIIPGFSDDRLQELRSKGISGTLTKEDEIEWFESTLNEIVNARLSISQVFQVVRKIELKPGVMDCLQMLNNFNVPVAIVSYGISEFIAMVIPEEDLGAIFASELRLDDGTVTGKKVIFHSRDQRLIVGYDKESIVLPSTKGGCSRQFADFYGVPYENILAVGDSGSDCELGFLKKNRLGIAEDEAHADKIRPFMGEVVISEDFYPVISWLENKIKV